MRDLTRAAVLLAITLPIACAHDARNAVAPTEPGPVSAGRDTGPPAPAVTNEPTVPGVPNASEGLVEPLESRPTVTLTQSQRESTEN
jgi:hypothetical protein